MGLPLFKKLKNKLKNSFSHQLPDNTIKENLSKWSKYNWNRLGEEWSNNEEWKQSLIDHIIKPKISIGSDILEIGPGGGRWTEHLVTRANNLFLVDLTHKCINICKDRFKNHSNIAYYVNDGNNLDFILDDSLDCIFSWDVFVHIKAIDIEGYIKQFPRILKKGGIAIIHHSKNGRRDAGWRSDMTANKMKKYCKKYNLHVLEQIETWDNGKYRIWPTIPLQKSPDIISVIINNQE